MRWKGQDEPRPTWCLREDPERSYISALQAIFRLNDKIGCTFTVKTHWERCEPGARRFAQRWVLARGDCPYIAIFYENLPDLRWNRDGVRWFIFHAESELLLLRLRLM